MSWSLEGKAIPLCSSESGLATGTEGALGASDACVPKVVRWRRRSGIDFARPGGARTSPGFLPLFHLCMTRLTM